MTKKEKNVFSCFSVFSVSFFLISVFCLLFAKRNFRVALLLNDSVGSFFRQFFLPVSNFFTFSLFEALVVCLPFWIFFLILYVTRDFLNKPKTMRRFINVVSMFLLLAASYVFSVGVGYSLLLFDTDNDPPEEKDTVFTAEYIREKITELSSEGQVPLDELADEIHFAYSGLDIEGITVSDVVPKPKPLKSSAFISRLGILANYSFITSEININTEAPYYTQVFSLAHEMAHVFGASGERDANFCAYLAMTESDNETLRYAAYLTAFEFVGRELFSKNQEAYSLIYDSLPERAKNDLQAYSDFYAGEKGALNEVSGNLNDKLIKVWDSEGAHSYEQFSQLLIEYVTTRFSDC